MAVDRSGRNGRRTAARPSGPAAALALACAVLIGMVGPVSATGSARVVYHGSRTQKLIALTFDDGWSAANCSRIYDILVRKNVTATWFPNSMYMEYSPALWKKIGARFPIANHTHSHGWLTRMSWSQVRYQLTHDEAVAERIIGRQILKLFRPPYGAYDTTVLQAAYSVGYSTAIMWDVIDSDTTRGVTYSSSLRDGTRGTNGSIVLMHCGPSITPQVLPAIIDTYRSRGFRFVTIPELLAAS